MSYTEILKLLASQKCLNIALIRIIITIEIDTN